jgi:hypothetical protein
VIRPLAALIYQSLGSARVNAQNCAKSCVIYKKGVTVGKNEKGSPSYRASARTHIIAKFVLDFERIPASIRAPFGRILRAFEYPNVALTAKGNVGKGRPTEMENARSEAARAMGRAKSEAKTRAARINGKLGGRPRKKFEPEPVRSITPRAPEPRCGMRWINAPGRRWSEWGKSLT